MALSRVLYLGQTDLELPEIATKKDNATGKYKRYTNQMGQYASETGTSAAVRKFRPAFPKINESTIRKFKKKYEDLKLAKQQNQEVRAELSTEKQGRPLFLGTEIDSLVQRYIRAASNRGAVVTRSIAESAAKAQMIRYSSKVEKINLNDSEYGVSYKE